MKALLIIPIVALATYLLYVRIKYKMTASISDTYKIIKGWEKPWFTITLWCVAVPIIIVGIENIPENTPQILFFIAGGLIVLVSSSPEFWSNKRELTAHRIGSYGGISFGIVACLVHYYSLVTLILVTIFVVFAILQLLNIKQLKIPNHIYWIEVAAIVMVSLVLVLN